MNGLHFYSAFLAPSQYHKVLHKGLYFTHSLTHWQEKHGDA